MTLEQLRSLLNEIKKNDWKNASELLKKFKFNINLTIENILGNEIDGPILLAAIDQQSSAFSRILVEEFEANVNKEIRINGRQSTLLIYLLSSRPK
jgi:hypothetical protein